MIDLICTKTFGKKLSNLAVTRLWKTKNNSICGFRLEGFREIKPKFLINHNKRSWNSYRKLFLSLKNLRKKSLVCDHNQIPKDNPLGSLTIPMQTLDSSWIYIPANKTSNLQKEFKKYRFYHVSSFIIISYDQKPVEKHWNRNKTQLFKYFYSPITAIQNSSQLNSQVSRKEFKLTNNYGIPRKVRFLKFYRKKTIEKIGKCKIKLTIW